MRKRSRRPRNDHAFEAAVRLFTKIEKGPSKKMTPFKRQIKQIRHLAASNLYWAKNPDKMPFGFKEISPTSKKRKMVREKRNYEFFMEHGDEVLSAQGSELDVLAEQFNVDKSLPVQEKQEQVYQTMADTYLRGDPAWTREKIIREKKHFLETLEKTHFPKLTCKLLDYDEKLVRTWIRTDPDFAEGVRACQLRNGERIAHAMLAKAITGDLGAQMYALKQFGNAVSFIEPDIAEGVSAADAGELQIDKLTPDEQETLLRLLRKAQDGNAQIPPTEFIEAEISPQIDAPAALEAESNEGEINGISSPPIIEYSGD